MIAVTIILFVSFSIFFPQTGFSNRWEDAEVILKGRDLLLTMDRIGLLSSYVSNPDAFAGFINKTIPEKNLLYWSTLDGTVQSRITVACNCTTTQIENLLNWIGRLKLNGRDIQIDVISSTLSPIQRSDVLLIWGRTNLAPFKSDILNYLRDGSGVVGISNIENPDSAYTEIFGVDRCQDVLSGHGGVCSGNGANELSFIVPADSSKLTFLPYKYFTHLPIRTVGTLGIAPVPLENASMPGCVENGLPKFPVFQGTFSFRSTDAAWWVCNQTTAFLDTNQNNLADAILVENNSFNIDNFKFRMSYIELNRTFVSIKPEYKFEDFRDNNIDLYPADKDSTKILLKDGNYNGGNPIPVVVANGTLSGRTLWSVDFLTQTPVNHDERLLIASMLMSASSKKTREPLIGSLQFGFQIPYINVASRDMFEVYQFNLGLGFPF